MKAGFRQMGVAFAVNPASAQVIDWAEDFGTPLRSPAAHSGQLNSPEALVANL
jgi:hypothetical protein